MRVPAPLALLAVMLASAAPRGSQQAALQIATEIATATPRHAGDTRHIVPPPVHDDAEIVINVPQRMLFLRRGGVVLHAFPVAVGRPGWKTPTGEFRVLTLEEHPYWDVPVSIQEEMRRNGQPVITRMAPGPRNPLGDYWLGLSMPGLGIHGTPAPSSIYQFATHGCIRLHPDDVRTLFGEVGVATRGEILYQPVLIARTAAGVFLEAHHDVYGRGDPGIAELRRLLGGDAAVDWDVAATVLRERDGSVHRIATVPR
jgi:L,D-transpeptidase ErfK/SrfK